MVASAIDEDMLTDGFMFDGSSIEGWKAINESDMILKPDLGGAPAISSRIRCSIPTTARPACCATSAPCRTRTWRWTAA